MSDLHETFGPSAPRSWDPAVLQRAGDQLHEAARLATFDGAAARRLIALALEALEQHDADSVDLLVWAGVHTCADWSRNPSGPTGDPTSVIEYPCGVCEAEQSS